MSFFKDSEGNTLEQTTEFVSGGLQPLIPAETQLLCAIAGATWEPETQYKGRTVKIMLHVVEKGEYKNFIVNDNLKVFDADPKKADKALNKLMTYDTLCKKRLFAADKAGKDIVDDNGLLARALNGGELVATFDVWELTGSDGVVRTGNWVRSIGPKPKAMQEEDKHIEKQAQSTQEALDDFDADIPF